MESFVSILFDRDVVSREATASQLAVPDPSVFK